MSLISVQASGHVKFKEFKNVNGKNMCSFTLSCSEKKWKGEGYDSVEPKVTLWEQQADFFNQHINDGDVCEVVGKLVERKWESGDKKGKSLEFMMPKVSFLPKPFSHNQETRQAPVVVRETIPKVPEPIEESTLPF